MEHINMRVTNHGFSSNRGIDLFELQERIYFNATSHKFSFIV